MMSFVVAEGAAPVREMISSEALGAATMRETLLEVVLPGLRTWTERLPAVETSAVVTGAVHFVTELHMVVRAVRAISKTEPGPGVEAAKLPPSTRRVKPLAAPAYTLAGCSARMFAPVAMVRLAKPDCDGSSLLMATGGGVRRWGGAGSGVDAAGVDCAARAWQGARGSLNLPDDGLIAGAEDGGGKLLYGQRGEGNGGRQNGYDIVIDYSDLRGGAARGVGEAGGTHGDGIGRGDCAGSLIVDLEIIAGG